MKRLFLLFVLPLALFSCKSGINAHKDAIEKLATSWDATTGEVTGFADMLTGDLTTMTTNASAFTLAEDVVAGLKGDAATKWTAATAAVQAASSAYAPLQGETSEFVKMWTEKSADVTALKDDLASGKYEGDAAAKIAELTGLATQAGEKLTAWKATQATLKPGLDTALETLKAAHALVVPAAK